MAQTVSEVLTAATDSVTIINDVNTNGSDSDYVEEGATQTEINETRTKKRRPFGNRFSVCTC